MALTTFHLFPFLPAELRWQIYFLATPPRFVHLQVKSLIELTEQEHEDLLTDFEVFTARLAPWNLSLDPSLAYFAHEWRDSIQTRESTPRSAWRFHPRQPHHATQTLLTSYGFSTTKQRRQPWPPTSRSPEVPLHLLYAQPTAAWQMTRPHALYSAAPIPPLLHTCAESRLVLMRHGYELAFRTRSTGPCTWFSFRHDTLYLPALPHVWNDPNEYDMHSPEPGPGDLHPDDLVRVRRLALEGIYPWSHYSDTTRTLRLCPNVRELFAVQKRVSSHDRDRLLKQWHRAAPEDTGIAEDEDDDDGDGCWEWIDCDEADGMSYIWEGMETIREIGLYGAGPEGDFLWRWKIAHGGDSAGYFEEYANVVEARLKKELEALQPERSGVKPWNIPSVKLVVVGMRSALKAVCKAREKYWLALREEEEREKERGVSPSNWLGR